MRVILVIAGHPAREQTIIVSIGRRQLQPMDARLDVKRPASETAVLIVDGRESPRLKWASKDRVYIETSMVISSDKSANN
jgi:hypothetical protein